MITYIVQENHWIFKFISFLYELIIETDTVCPPVYYSER